jgi:hypothetical protein
MVFWKLSSPCFGYSGLLRGRSGLLISHDSKERTCFIFENVGWLLYPCGSPWLTLEEEKGASFCNVGNGVSGIQRNNPEYCMRSIKSVASWGIGMTDYLHISPEVIGIYLNFPTPPDVNRSIDDSSWSSFGRSRQRKFPRITWLIIPSVNNFVSEVSL